MRADAQSLEKSQRAARPELFATDRRMLYFDRNRAFGPSFSFGRAVPTIAPVDPVGEWLSLVEHLVRDQGVGGSNPLSPTNFFKHLKRTSGFPSTAGRPTHSRPLRMCGCRQN